VSDIPGNHDVKELQKRAIFDGTRYRGTINNKDRIDATMYPLGTWFVSGIRVWIPCIKETTTTTTMMMMMIIIIIIIIITIMEKFA
jgi:hypothetical protein